MKSLNVRLSNRLALAAAVGAASLFSIQSASAQTPVNNWTGTAGDNLWATDANWSVGSFPRIDNSVGRADDVYFNDGGGALSITLPISQTAGKLNFLNTATTSLLGNGPGNGLSLRHGINVAAGAGAVSIAGSTNLNGTGQTYTNNSANTLAIASNVVNQNNASNITFTVDGSGPISLNAGGGSISNGGGATTHLLKTGTGTFSWGSSSFLGNTTINSGGFVIGGSNAFGASASSHTLTFDTVPVGGTTPSLTTNNTSTRTINNLVSVTLNSTPNLASFAGGRLTFSGVLSGAGGVNVTGGTVQLSAANSYGGVSTVTAGKLDARNSTALGTSGGASDYTEVLGTGATASFNGTVGMTIGEELRIAGDGFADGSSGAITVENSATGTVFNGPVSLTGPATLHITGTSSATFNNTITSPGHTLTLQGGNNPTGNGTITGAISLGAGGLDKRQTSIWTLSNSGNDWSGTTSIVNGTLRYGANNVIPSGAGKGNVSMTGGTIDLNGFSGAINGLSGTAGTIDNVAAGGASVLTVGGNNQGGTFAGTIQNTTGTVAVTKTGTGTLTLSGASNTYSGGTNANAGTLEVAKMHAGNAVNVAAGATLRVLESSPGVSSGHPAGDNAFVSTPSSLTVDPAGTVDITNNDIVLDYTGATPVATYEQLVRSAYNVTGDWQGTGITSSIAANDGNYVVAIADNATLAAPFGTAQGGPLFAGVDVDLDTVLIKFTHRADINLDGVVTPDDSAVFGGNYDEGQPAVWATGDMNYDGIFTPDDAAIFGGAYDESLASLPEPGSLAALGLLGLGLARRSRRSRA